MCVIFGLPQEQYTNSLGLCMGGGGVGVGRRMGGERTITVYYVVEQAYLNWSIFQHILSQPNMFLFIISNTYKNCTKFGTIFSNYY